MAVAQRISGEHGVGSTSRNTAMHGLLPILRRIDVYRCLKVDFKTES
jgi:hypothetical protein